MNKKGEQLYYITSIKKYIPLESRKAMLEKEKLIFHPITLEDKNWINEKLKKDNISACEYTFANNFVWAKAYDVQVGEAYNCGIIRYRKQENFEYSFPFGTGDKKAAIELIKGICAAHGHGLWIYPIVDADRLKIIDWFPGEFELDADRADFDYVYKVEKLSSLRGKKLHGKRNHIARFMDDGDWHYEAMTKENIEECRKMAEEWVVMRAEKWNEDMEREMEALKRAFSYFDELGLTGGVLYKKEKIVAFTIGEQLSADTFVLHFEKAYPDLQGAYPMINQQFVLHELLGFTYVNREEDTGDEGIRKAKMSYYPDILVKKYVAKESAVIFANEKDHEAVIDIWQSSFGDSREYIEFYLDKRFETENMLVVYKDKKPVSMASFLPVQVTMNKEKVPAKYVYAVATLPAYRKKGYAAQIMNYAAQKYQEPLILQPAQESLVQYYHRLGFKRAFRESPCWVFHGNGIKFGKAFRESAYWVFHGSKTEVECAPEFLAASKEPTFFGEWVVTKATPTKYKEIRDNYFAGEGYVEWDEKAILYAIEENYYCNGETLQLTKKEQNSKKEQTAAIMYRKEGNKLKIVEAAMDEEEFRKILGALLDYTSTTQAYAKNSGGMIWLPKTATRWNFQEGYLNLTLD